MGKKRVKFFVSYARANRKLADDLIARLKDQFGPSKRYRYDLWRDTEILVGEDWHGEIQEALENCDFGLLLLSLSFLQRSFIEKEELPKFIGKRAKPVFPVALQTVDFELHDLKGLKEKQIFRLEGTRFTEPKAYGDCTALQREKFARELFRQIEARLGKVFGGL